MALKVRVKVVNACSVEMAPATEFVFASSDKIHAVKERLSEAMELPPFESDLMKGGQALADAASLEDCQIGDGASLMLKVSATDAVLVDQLKDLIGDKCLAIEEVGMLYVHSHGVTVGNALDALGHQSKKLPDFISDQKVFQVVGGRVKLVTEPPSEKCLAPPARASALAALAPVAEDEVVAVAEDAARGDEQLELPICIKVTAGDNDVEETTEITIPSHTTVAQAKAYIAQTEMIPYAIYGLEVRGAGPLLDDGASLADCCVRSGSELHVLVHASEQLLATQLASILEVRSAMSPDELGLHYSYKYGCPVARALKLLGHRANLRRFVEENGKFVVDKAWGVSVCYA